jgi:signal transduction histidine kinase
MKGLKRAKGNIFFISESENTLLFNFYYFRSKSKCRWSQFLVIIPFDMVSRRKIFIIDDDEHTINILNYVLETKDYELRHSLSGDDGLREMESYCPDLILLDIRMPGIDGFEVVQRLKQDKRFAGIPVIFITASNETAELVKGFNAGAVDFITKPINRAELLARVNTHLELKIARDIIEQKNSALKKEIINHKQTEEKFRALSETTFEAVLFLHRDRIIEYNKAAADLFNLEADKRFPPSVFNYTDARAASRLKNILEVKNHEGPWEIPFRSGNNLSFHGQVQFQTLNYKGKKIKVLAVRDITRQKEIDKQIFNAIIEAEEKERKRFSRDMHDGLGALLSTLKIYVSLLQKGNKSEQEKEMLLQEMKETIGKSIEAARTIANNLMPGVLMDHGLIKALRSFTDALRQTGVINIDYVFPSEIAQLEPNMETHIYRIVLELINNTLKYADATLITIIIEFDYKRILLLYRDNGKGFDFGSVYNTLSGSQGLKNILSRVNFMNGEAEFITSAGNGLSFRLEAGF